MEGRKRRPPLLVDDSALLLTSVPIQLLLIDSIETFGSARPVAAVENPIAGE